LERESLARLHEQRRRDELAVDRLDRDGERASSETPPAESQRNDREDPAADGGAHAQPEPAVIENASGAPNQCDEQRKQNATDLPAVTLHRVADRPGRCSHGLRSTT